MTLGSHGAAIKDAEILLHIYQTNVDRTLLRGYTVEEVKCYVNLYWNTPSSAHHMDSSYKNHTYRITTFDSNQLSMCPSAPLCLT